MVFEGSDRFFRKTKDLFRLVECADCGLSRLSPYPSETQLAEFAPAIAWWESLPALGTWLVERLRMLAMGGQLRFVRTSAAPDSPVLDVNGGLAAHRAILQDFGYTVQAKELSALRQPRGGDRPAGPTHSAESRSNGSSATRYGTVAALHVLEHGQDPAADLAVLRRLLARGGSLILQFPNAGSWQALVLADRWNGFDVPRHPMSFTEESFEGLLAACGLKALRYKRFLLRDQAAGLATSLCPWLDPAVRRERRVMETRLAAACKDMLYLVLVVAAAPLAILEALSGAGSAIMVEARRADDEVFNGRRT